MQQQLADEELNTGTTSGAAAWIALGLKLEEEQYVNVYFPNVRWFNGHPTYGELSFSIVPDDPEHQQLWKESSR